MKYSVLIFLLTSTLCPPSSTNYKLLASSAAKRSIGHSISAWARKHSGIIASKSITSLIGTLGLVGAMEAVRIAREAATSPADQAELDALLSSLSSVKDSFQGSRNPANLDGLWVSMGGLAVFTVSMIIVISVMKCCKKDQAQCDRDSASANQETPDQGKMCTQCEPVKAESEAIVNIESSSV